MASGNNGAKRGHGLGWHEPRALLRAALRRAWQAAALFLPRDAVKARWRAAAHMASAVCSSTQPGVATQVKQAQATRRCCAALRHVAVAHHDGSSGWRREGANNKRAYGRPREALKGGMRHRIPLKHTARRGKARRGDSAFGTSSQSASR